MSDRDGGVEAVARWLCKSAEYMDANWRLYIPRAQDLIGVYLKAVDK